MTKRLILASMSRIRLQLLTNAGVRLETVAAGIDEDAIRLAMEAEGAKPRDVADALAEFKARKISDKFPDALVIGCDQVLEIDGKILGKPSTQQIAISQLQGLSGKSHRLLSAVVVCEDGRPIWRHIGIVRLHMRPLSDGFVQDYVDRNWDSIRDSVGGYKLEQEGARLFTRIEGDYFTVLGLPLLELLSWLTLKGILRS